MLTINFIFFINFFVFGIFASLLITELMGSVLLLLFWNSARSRVLEYIIPIWEVTGTFGAFWVVITDFAYPGILIPASKLYAVAFMLFLILFVARNASIVFGEYIIKKRWLDDRKLYKTYAVSTLALGIVALTIFSSIITGSGVNISGGYFSITEWITDPGSILFILGALLIGVGLAPVFFDLGTFRKITVPVTAVGVTLSVLSYYLSSASLISPLIAIPVILTVLVPVLYTYTPFSGLVSNKLVFSVVSTIILFSLSPLVYPTAFGKSLEVDAVTTSGPMAQAFMIITLVGGIILAVMIFIYLLAVRKSARARIPGAAQ